MHEPTTSPKDEINNQKQKDIGHDNRTFTTSDETQLPTITSLVNGSKRGRGGIENSRL